MEHAIFTHLLDFLDSNSFFHSSHHGFHKRQSCETQLAIFLDHLHSNLDTNTQTDAIFLDFTKAFDKVAHKRLLLKLSQLNIHLNVLKWIKEFLIVHNLCKQVTMLLIRFP